MWLAYLSGFALAFAVSLILAAVVIRVAPKLGFVDAPAARKVHTQPVPLGGGIAILGAILLISIAAGAAILSLNADPSSLPLPKSIAPYIPGMASCLPQAAAILLGALILAAMGLVDDLRGLSAWKKLLIQIAVAVLLVASGLSVTLFVPFAPAGWLFTVVWIVFVTNSFNLLDNMDGLSSGVALIISTVFFVVAVETGQLFIALFLPVFAGAVLGFLIFNFPPAKLFMGDTGSYLLGYFLGVAAIVFKFVPPGTTQASLLPLALPFILFAVPFYDTLSVIFIRLREGRHLFDADKRHFSHRLTDLGLNKREAVFTIYAATLVTAFHAIYIYELNALALLGAVTQAILVLCLIAVLEHAGTRKK